jgi:hypothetical protein
MDGDTTSRVAASYLVPRIADTASSIRPDPTHLPCSLVPRRISRAPPPHCELRVPRATDHLLSRIPSLIPVHAAVAQSIPVVVAWVDDIDGACRLGYFSMAICVDEEASVAAAESFSQSCNRDLYLGRHVPLGARGLLLHRASPRCGPMIPAAYSRDARPVSSPRYLRVP